MFTRKVKPISPNDVLKLRTVPSETHEQLHLALCYLWVEYMLEMNHWKDLSGKWS